MNILFLGGAKRVGMARAFKAVEPCHIFSYELTDKVPIAIEAERIIIGKRWADPDLDADLRRVVSDYAIDVVLPFVDGAVEPAARLRDVAFVPAPEPEQARLMFDKVRCDTLLRSLELPVPDKYDASDRKFIAKPRFGSASKGLVYFSGRSALGESEDYLVQECIDNRREITVDCYVDTILGTICAAVPRYRLEVSGGEVTRSRTFHSQRVSDLAREVLSRTGLRGAITVQFIEDLNTDRLMVMEINPRLGGGCVCSVAAGANIPEMILRNARSEEIQPISDYKDIEMVRYSSEVFFLFTDEENYYNR